MKVFGFISILLFAVSIFGQTNVSITDGSGEGKYRGQSIVDIWARPNPVGMVFDRWTGDTNLLNRTDEWNAKLKTGTKNISLTATYKTVKPWLPSDLENIGTTEMRYHFPQNVRGVVFHFHGTGGSADGMFNNIEQITFARELVAEGYAIVTLNSDDRINQQWNATNSLANPDINNVQLAINEFISRGLITKNTPIFGSGVSNGGGFVPRVSFFLNFHGTAIFIATGPTAFMSVTEIPTIWNIMQNDTVLANASVVRARNNFNNLQSRGIPSEINILHPTPVYPERFWRIFGINRTESIELHNALKSNGFFDARNYLKENPQFSNWESVIPTKYNPFINDIKDQLWICFTEHKFFSNYNRRVIRFFNSLH